MDGALLYTVAPLEFLMLTTKVAAPAVVEPVIVGLAEPVVSELWSIVAED
jgi:hypothetical protein